jgi:predicted transposase/invertase (TIGR01784 family)
MMNQTNTKYPYANLMTDLTFKKAFNPDNESTKINLINLLNDLLDSQIPNPIVDVFSQDKEINQTGSKTSKTSVVDLRCQDSFNNTFVVEIQIKMKTNFFKRIVYYSSQLIVQQGILGQVWDYDVKPVYIISIVDFELFPDQELVHRASICNIESGIQLIDSVNYTFIELRKLKKLDKHTDDLRKWIYLFKNLNKLESLPEVLHQKKFKNLLSYTEVAKFTKEEFQQYLKEMHFEWDTYAEELYTKTRIEEGIKKGIEQGLQQGIEKGIQQGIEQGIEQGALQKAREMAKNMLKKGLSISDIMSISGLSEEEIRSL